MASVRATEPAEAHIVNRRVVSAHRIVVYSWVSRRGSGRSPLEQGTLEGDSPVCAWGFASYGPYAMSRVAWECSSNGW
jgi:hypothetical protein